MQRAVERRNHGDPFDLICLAVGLAHLERLEEARECYARATAQLHDDSLEGDHELVEMKAQAERLLGPSSAPPRRSTRNVKQPKALGIPKNLAR